MIIFGEKQFVESNFKNEDEIEQVVFDNYEYLFGPSSFLLPKTLIKTTDGIGTIPDGFAIDLANRKWYLVEAELIKHSVWNHIAPQVSKQIIAAQQDITRKLLVEVAVNQYTQNENIKNSFAEESISEIDVRRVLNEILETEPIVGIPIDEISDDLQEWARTLKSVVKLWKIKKFVDLNDSNNIIYEFPEEHKPSMEMIEEVKDENKQIKSYNVSVKDLLDSGLLDGSRNLYFTYGQKNTSKDDKYDYLAYIQDDGTFQVDNRIFTSPSYAALYCINKAGSPRKTINGWGKWRTLDGELLKDLRDKYLELKNNE